MNQTVSRALLYGGAVAALAGIGIGMAVVESEADTMTMLSSADVQLRLAYGIPATDKNGQPMPAREQMIRESIDLLERAEKATPGMAVTAEFRGFAHMLQGEFAEAAVCYARARDCDDCGDEQRDVLAFNEARMLRRAGRHEAALATFEEHAVALDSRFGAQRRIEQAAVLRETERHAEASQVLASVLADTTVEPMAWVQAGQELMLLGDTAGAETAFRQAVEQAPLADYYLAQLKLAAGEVDSAFESLERAVAGAPADVRRLVREDPDAWQRLAGDERFQELTGHVPASPGR
ncbi:MAG: hypothetical protein NXI31_00015 [bacterium]|nr:hypothetical protein [bacterium]